MIFFLDSFFTHLNIPPMRSNIIRVVADLQCDNFAFKSHFVTFRRRTSPRMEKKSNFNWNCALLPTQFFLEQSSVLHRQAHNMLHMFAEHAIKYAVNNALDISSAVVSMFVQST